MSDDEHPEERESLTCRGIMRKITVEPVFFLSIFADLVVGYLNTKIIMERVCEVEFGDTVEHCRNISSNKTLENDVYKTTASITLYIGLIKSIPSIFLVPILGHYSDVYGRKLPLLLPIMGSGFTYAALMVFVHYSHLSPYWVLACFVPSAVSGGSGVILAAGFAYISDNSSTRSRTSRMAMCTVAIGLGATAGFRVSALVFDRGGYWAAYSLAAGTCVVTVLYILVVVRNVATLMVTAPAFSTPWLLQFLRGGEEALRTCVKPRPNYGRARVFLGFAVILLYCVMLILSSNFLIYFVQQQLQWDYSQLTNYSIASVFLETIGAVLVVMVAVRVLGLPEEVAGVLSAALRCPGYVVVALATSSVYMYVAAGLSAFSIVPVIVARSVLSKSVPPEELGKVFSVLAVLETAAPVALLPAATAVYEATAASCPGAVFLLAAVAAAGMAAVMLAMAILRGRAGVQYDAVVLAE